MRQDADERARQEAEEGARREVTFDEPATSTKGAHLSHCCDEPTTHWSSSGTCSAVCMICMEPKPVSSSLVCPAHSAESSHLICEECVSGTVVSLFGTAELRNRDGGLCCYANDDKHGEFPRPTVFKRQQVEALLNSEARRRYLEVGLYPCRTSLPASLHC